MVIYLTWFFISVFIAYFTKSKSKKTQIIYASIYLGALGVFVGMGDMLGGYDRYIYGELFDRMADVTNRGGNPLRSNSFYFYGSEFGYGLYSAFITYITANRYIYIFITTLLIYFLLILSLRKYAENMPFAVVVFLGLWFFFTFTYLRQILACAIVWLAVQYIIERDLKKYLLVCLIAYSFHNSTLVFVPVYFLPMKKYAPQKVIVLMAVALLIGLTPIPQTIFTIYGDVSMARISVESYAEDAGFRFAYLIESVFFIWLILTNYSRVSETRKDVVLLNLAIIFCAILLVFIRSENGGRLGWIFMIGVICTITKICVNNKQIVKQGVFIIIVCLFLYLRIYNSWQKYLNLYPYKTFMTNGYREGDYSWERYEYDHNYDIDKFYRK